MKVILPVAGKGTRLRPHTHAKAKSLVQVAGKTVLEHIISRLEPLDIEEYIFIIDANGEQIKSFMAANFPALNCTYTVQQDRLGPAHAVWLAAPFIKPGDDVLVVFNDTIFVTDLTIIDRLSADCDGLIYSKEVEDYQRFGVNVVKSGLIVDMVEKPDTPISRLAQVGLYYLKDAAAFMDYLQQTIDAEETVKGEYYLPSVFMRMISAGKKFRAPEIDAWLDCGTAETLLETNRYLLQGRHHAHGKAVDSVLIEPVYIGAGVVIRNAIIGPNVSISSDCVVEDSIVKDSIINSGCVLQSIILKHSILGDSVRLSGSPKTLNIGDNSLIDLGE